MGLEEVRGTGGSEIRRVRLEPSIRSNPSELASYEVRQLRERVGSGEVGGGEYDHVRESGRRSDADEGGGGKMDAASHGGGRVRSFSKSTPIRELVSFGISLALKLPGVTKWV